MAQKLEMRGPCERWYIAVKGSLFCCKGNSFLAKPTVCRMKFCTFVLVGQNHPTKGAYNIKKQYEKNILMNATETIHTENVFKDYGSFENTNNDKIVCFNISKSYLRCERPNLYECTRKYWRVNGKRAQNADLVFAVCSGYIVGVFKPTHWHLTDSKEYADRWEFEGEEIADAPFINMSIAHLWGKRQNPVMYINM